MKVYDYKPEVQFACEGVAVETPNGLRDTFWDSGPDNHYLSPAESQSAQLRFDTYDYDELYESNERTTAALWKSYAPADRATIPSQHGLRLRYFVRKGSAPDLATKIANARDALEAAEQKLEVAAVHVRWCHEDLDELLARTQETTA